MSQGHPILAGDHTSRWMGITVDRAEYGLAQIRMTLREEMLNGFGIAHGGMVFAFADTCFALACNDPAGDGTTITVAAGVDINFLASAYRGQELTAVGTVRAQAGRSGVYDIQVLADDRLPLNVYRELTTGVTFRLIGGSGTRLAARRASRGRSLRPSARAGARRPGRSRIPPPGPEG